MFASFAILITIAIEILILHVFIGVDRQIGIGAHLLLSEPALTPSVIARIPDLLKEIISETEGSRLTLKRKSIMLSSNGLCNRFILARWGIRPSQRRRHKNLFSDVRKACRNYFNYLLNQGRITSTQETIAFDFGVFKFDEIRGNLILGFTPIEQNPFL